MEFSEEIKDLYFKLQRKNSWEPREYTMGEIEIISREALEIIHNHNVDHEAIPAFKKVKERSDYYHINNGTARKIPKNILEVKELAIQAFQEFFDIEPGITP